MQVRGPAARHHKEAQQQRNAAVQQWHAAAAEAARLTREQAIKERLAALKAKDVVGYLHLAQSVKGSRIKELLAQTDACLKGLASRLHLPELLGPAQREPADQASAAGATDSLAALKESQSPWNILGKLAQAETMQQPAMLKGRLYNYQLQGLSWLLALQKHGLNGILADEMGLGKTVQTVEVYKPLVNPFVYTVALQQLQAHAMQIIALLAYLKEARDSSLPSLIVMPASLIDSWHTALSDWAPGLKVLAYHGDAAQREHVWLRQVKQSLGQFDVMLTTYEHLMSTVGLARLATLRWQYMVVDEGHRLRNPGCKLASAAQQYRVQHRLLLTGTPLQNRLDELWALLNFLMPSLFDSSQDFDKWFGCSARPSIGTAEGPGSSEAVLLSQEESLLVTMRLHQVLRPFVLRRLKHEVAGNLPKKTERLILCSMSPYQAALCQLVTGHEFKPVTNPLMELRTICNHPLISRLHPEGAEETLPAGILPAELCLCGKMELLDRVLTRLHASGHKVLVFSTMTRVLDVIEDYSAWRGFQHVRLDGSTSPAERGSLVQAFNAPGSPIFMFLLSIRAGGVGLNLQAADTVIMYDSDWNPQMDLQAQARAHRLGQTREVLVLRLQTEGTVEQRVTQLAAEKRGFADRTITGGFFDGTTSAEQRQHYLMDLLRSDAQPHCPAEEGHHTTDEELDAMLARSSEELALFESQRAKLARRPGTQARLATAEQAAQLISRAKEAAIVIDPDAGRQFGRGKRRQPAAAAPAQQQKAQGSKRMRQT